MDVLTVLNGVTESSKLLLLCLDAKQHVLLLLVDLSAAFDISEHDMFAARLKEYIGIKSDPQVVLPICTWSYREHLGFKCHFPSITNII